MTAKIKLNAASGGGSFSLQAPSSSANNRVFTLPDSADATLLTSTTATGKILQVLQTTKVDIQSIQSQSFTDVTGLAVTITPTSASSKILVMFSISVVTTSYGMVKLVRGSTNIFQGTATGNQVNCTVAAITQNSYECETYSHTFLDSPNTTSATTYKLTAGSPYDAGYIIYVNRAPNDTNYSYVPRPVSSITVMEVAA